MVTYSKNHLKLHIFGENDIEGLLSLSQSIGWDYDRSDIQTILSCGKIFGHKNELGQIVSSAAIIPYDTDLASIGMVIVNPGYRGQGLGKDTTKACIDSVSAQTSIMLIATPEGKPMYEKMGFKVVDDVHKFICMNYVPSDGFPDEGLKAEVLQDDEFEKVFELDKFAFGDFRRKFLTNRIKQSHQSLVLKNEMGDVLGFGLSVLGPCHLLLGPIVAPNDRAAAYLLHQLALNHKGKLRIDLPARNERFMNHLRNSGFEKVSQPPVMIIHSDSMPTRNSHLYGIAAQVFG
ncbi:GNAT family N-acetyltransferase [Bacillus sp. FJAT-42376]|nr:GNAT family N-acetyltransferase [Bacillus sp. FJAT-42376]